MSIYGRVTRSGNPQNPARALHSHWMKILNLLGENDGGRIFGSATIGENVTINVVSHGNETGHSARPNLELRYNWRTLFQLTAKGEFRMASNYNGGWGYGGTVYRNLVVKHTFLMWSQIARDYVWWVDTEATHGAYQHCYGAHDLRNFNHPIPYLSERALGSSEYSSEPHWMKLEPEGLEWHMRFSRLYGSRQPAYDTEPYRRETIAKFEALREKRYRLNEREHLIDTGVLDPVTKRPIPTEEELAARRERDVEVLIAGMTVTQPARTRSLVQRTTEEVGLWEAPSGVR
jgi:hypothetical protein